MRRYALHDDQWERIKDLLPGRKRHVGTNAKRRRDAVLPASRPPRAQRTAPPIPDNPLRVLSAPRDRATSATKRVSNTRVVASTWFSENTWASIVRWLCRT